MKRTSKRNSDIIREWNSGRTKFEISTMLGISRNAVSGVLKRARDNGTSILAVDGCEAGRRRMASMRKNMGDDAYLSAMREKIARANTFRKFRQAEATQ